MSDMEWEDLDPIVKTVPWCKAWVTVNNDGKARLNLSFSEATLNDCGHPKKANVMVGTKDGKTMVRLVWGTTGKFDVRGLEKGGARIHAIPCKAPVPDGAREQEPCEVELKNKQEAIFILPLEAWEAQLNKPLPLRPTPKPPAAPAHPQASCPSGARAKAFAARRGGGLPARQGCQNLQAGRRLVDAGWHQSGAH